MHYPRKFKPPLILFPTSQHLPRSPGSTIIRARLHNRSPLYRFQGLSQNSAWSFPKARSIRFLSCRGGRTYLCRLRCAADAPVLAFSTYSLKFSSPQLIWMCWRLVFRLHLRSSLPGVLREMVEYMWHEAPQAACSIAASYWTLGSEMSAVNVSNDTRRV